MILLLHQTVNRLNLEIFKVFNYVIPKHKIAKSHGSTTFKLQPQNGNINFTVKVKKIEMYGSLGLIT